MPEDTTIYALDTDGNILGLGVVDTNDYPEGTLFIEASPSMGFMRPKWNFETGLWEEGSTEDYPVTNPNEPPLENNGGIAPPDLSDYVSKAEFQALQKLSLNLYEQVAQIRSETADDSRH